MIPKIFHFIWLGKKNYNDRISECINSWHITNPDYKIMKWDEQNIPVNIEFVNYMIAQKKWAFASDCLRFWILYNYGGIYLDTDMKLLKNINHITKENHLFFGKENKSTISGGIIGCVKQNQIIKDCLSYYLNLNNDKSIESFEQKKVLLPNLITTIMTQYFPISDEDKDERFNGVNIYASEYFYPLSFEKRKQLNSFIPDLNKNYGLHLWEASWHDEYNHLYHQNYLKSIILFKNKLFEGKVNVYDFYKYIKTFIIILIKILFK